MSCSWFSCRSSIQIEFEFRMFRMSEQGENQQQTPPTYDAGNQTRATLVGGECSHHCAIPGSSLLPKDDNILEHRY